MYSYSEDEAQLLFIDAFGLTRLSAPKQLKTDRKIMGSDAAGLATISRSGNLGVSYEDLWDKSVLWSLPELKSVKRFDRFREAGAVIHPEGSHYIVAEGGALRFEPAAKTVLLPLRLDEDEHAEAGAQAVSVALTGGEQLPALELGGDQSPDVPVPLRIAHDGTVVMVAGQRLTRARLAGTTVTVEWQRSLLTPERARVEVVADAERTVIMVHRDRRWTIVVLEGGEQRRLEIETLAVPACAGPYLAYQPRADRVIREHLSTGERSEHPLAVYDKKRKFDLSNEGAATLMLAPSGRLLVLAGHRESLIDVDKSVEISRKLPAKLLELRQTLLNTVRPYADAARLAGVDIELGRVELNAKQEHVGITHRIAGGDSVLGGLLAGISHSIWSDFSFPDGWRMGSYGAHGGLSAPSDLSREALVEAYGSLAQMGFGFAPTIGFWADQFGDFGGDSRRDPAVARLLAQALIVVLRDGPDASLDFGALASAGAPSLADAQAALARYPERSEAFGYNTTTLICALFNDLFGPDAAQLWIAVFLEATNWSRHGTHYTDFDHRGITALIEAHPGAAAPFREWLRTHDTPTDDRAWAIDQLRARLAGS